MELKQIKSDWKDFCGRNYIVKKLYSCFSLCDDHYNIVPCPYGGPFLRKRLRPSTFFDFIANNGEKAVSRDINCEDDIYKVFWCSGGKIGVLTINGNVRIHRISGELISSTTCSTQYNVIASSEFYNGIAFLKENGDFLVYDSFLQKIHKITTVTSKLLHGMKVDDVECIDFIRGNQNECFAAFKNEIFCISEKGTVPVKTLSFNPTTIRISSLGSYVAATNGKQIRVFSVAEGAINDDFQVSMNGEISSFSFVDEGRVACVIGDKLYMIYESESSSELPFEGVSFVVQDYDHTRVFTKNGVHVIVPISGPIKGLLRNKKINIILDARRRFDSGDFNTLQVVNDLETEIPRIFQTLILAAGDLLDQKSQEILMSAASFILHSLDTVSKSVYVEKYRTEYTDALRKIRFINTLRSAEFGFTTTTNCLNIMSLASCIEFAMEMNRFEFAYKACNMFEYNNTVVANYWANTMFYLYGDKALRSVIGKLEIIQNVDYPGIVKSAMNARLSAKSLNVLIDRVRNPEQKCCFLIDMNAKFNDEKDALEYAVDSLDGSAIIRSLFYKLDTLNPQKFGAILANQPRALDHYIAYKRFSNAKQICQIEGLNAARAMQVLITNELPPEQFGVVPQQMLALSRLLDKRLIWSKTVRRHGKALIDFEDKEQASKTKDSTETQLMYDTKKTPRELVKEAIKKGDGKFAQAIAKRYHVSPRTYTFIQLQAFAEAGNWSSIERMGDIKQPLSFEEFIKFCMENNNKFAAMTFVKKLKPVQKQIDILHEYHLDAEANIILQNSKNKK